MTGRLLGKRGILYIGTASGGSQTYQGADLENWKAEYKPDIEVSEDLADSWKVKKARVGDWVITAEKFTTSVAFLNAAVAQLTTPVAAYFVGYRGGNTGLGAEVCRGEVILGPAFYDNPLGWAKEGITLEGTGALTVAAT